MSQMPRDGAVRAVVNGRVGGVEGDGVERHGQCKGMSPLSASQLETAHRPRQPNANMIVGHAISGEFRRATSASCLIVEGIVGDPWDPMKTSALIALQFTHAIPTGCVGNGNMIQLASVEERHRRLDPGHAGLGAQQ